MKWPFAQPEFGNLQQMWYLRNYERGLAEAEAEEKGLGVEFEVTFSLAGSTTIHVLATTTEKAVEKAKNLLDLSELDNLEVCEFEVKKCLPSTISNE